MRHNKRNLPWTLVVLSLNLLLLVAGCDEDPIGSVDAGDAGVECYPDADADGYGAATAVPQISGTGQCPAGFAPAGTDCNDANPAVKPTAWEVVGDGLDNDCNPATPDSSGGSGGWVDADGDGWSAQAGDCNDANAWVYPGAGEICSNGRDDDCDGSVDEGCGGSGNQDADGDGWTTGEGDCNDARANVHPGATEVCNDGLDNDCDGLTDGADPNCGSSSTQVPTCANVTIQFPAGYGSASQFQCTAAPFGAGVIVNAVAANGSWAAHNGWPEARCNQRGTALVSGVVAARQDLISWESWTRPDPVGYTRTSAAVEEGGCDLWVR